MELIRRTGLFAPDVKLIVHPELTIVGYARDAFDAWITIAHGLTIVLEKRIKNTFYSS